MYHHEKDIKMKLTLLFMIVIFLGFLGIGYMHEQVHVEIFRSYKIESHVEYLSHFPDFVTIADGNYSMCTESCVLAHNINEVVGYHLLFFYVMIGLGIWIIIAIMELKLWKEYLS